MKPYDKRALTSSAFADTAVMAGLVPAIPLREAEPCVAQRDRRDKPGDDVREAAD